MAPLIWPTPELCSCEAAVISCTSSEVFLIDGTISVSSDAGAFGELHRILGDVADFLRGDLRAFGELPHFGGDDGEALAVFAGARRLDRGVQASRLVW
jgi:hypothetical protein